MNEPRPHAGDEGLARRRILAGGLALTAAGAVSGVLGATASAGPVTTDGSGDRIQTLPRGQLPDFARGASARAQEAYRYAADRGSALEAVPCFCGCTNIGHRHNRDCYVKSLNRDGTVTWTSHAVG